MKKEKNVFVETIKDKGVEVFKDFDFSKLNRDYIRVAPFDELLRLFRSQTPEFWLNLTQSSENPLPFLILALLAHSGKLTQNSCKDVINVIIVRISKNDKEYYNLYNLYNTYNLYNFYKNDNQTTVYLSRTFSKFLKDGFIEFAGTEPTGTKPATLYQISLKGIRRLFYYCLPHPKTEDLSSTIEELAPEFISFLELNPPLHNGNSINLRAMLQFSPQLFDFFKSNPLEFMDGLLPLVENRLDTKIARKFGNFPGPDSFEYSSPKAEALGHICHLEGSISSMSPPKNKIIEVQCVCPSCNARFAYSVVEQKPHLFCKLCGSPLKTISKKSEDYLVFNLRVNGSDFDLIFEASCGAVSEIKTVFERNQPCKFLGVLHSKPMKKNSIIEDFYYSLVAIEPSLKEIEIDDTISPLPLKNLVSRFCPAVVGLEDAKLALLASIVRAGRPRKERLNLLLAGDPGTGKSYLFTESQKYLAWLPCGLVDGGNSSAVGILGGAVRSDAGGWSIVRGSLAQASGGLLFVEELTSLPSEVLDKFKQSLESGAIVISKAGLAVSFQAETSLVASCNACKGLFDKTRPLSTQIPMSSAMLDRFDLKIGIFKGDVSHRAIATKMVNLQNETTENVDFLSGYFKKAHSISPKFDKGAQVFFAENATLPPRQMRAVKNLSLAIAQLRLSELVEKNDITFASSFVEKYNKMFFGSGENEGYYLESSAIKAILSLLENGPIPEKELLKKLNPTDKTLIVETIGSLLRKGDINRTAKGLEKVV